MKRHILLTATSAFAVSMSTPAAAQTASAAEEIAALKAQMAAMAERLEVLEDELEEARSVADEAASAAAAATQQPAAKDDGVEVNWKGAPEIKGKGGWSFKPRGRLMVDAGFTSAPDSTGRDDGFGNEIRRARLGVAGDIPGGFGYKFELDFDGTEVAVTDAFISYEDGPVTFQVGQHNNFQSLDELTSSLHSSFIERAAFTDAFGFQRRVGASVQYSDGPILVQTGLFTDSVDALSNKNWGADIRAVAMPKVGNTQLHFGGSLHHYDLQEGSTVRYRQRPMVHFTSERFVNTGSFDAESEFGAGLEAAVLSGRFHAMAEAYWQSVDSVVMGDPTFFGGAAEIGFFLTPGDKRGYKGGKFDRIKPANPVGKGGIGAVQLNLRYDHLDLNDGMILGGIQDGYAVSLIWQLTNYTRFMLNYGRMDYTDAVHPAAGGDTSYSVDAFGARAQIDF